jgi:hypothetical protein
MLYSLEFMRILDWRSRRTMGPASAVAVGDARAHHNLILINPGRASRAILDSPLRFLDGQFRSLRAQLA